MSITLGYSIIKHEPRIKFDLKVGQACVLGIIHHLCTSPRAPLAGWCTAGSQKIADFLGDTTRQTVYRWCIDMEEKGLIERVEKPVHKMRTTVLYYDEFECFAIEKSVSKQLDLGLQIEGTKTSTPGNINVHSEEQNGTEEGTKSSTIITSKNKVNNKVKRGDALRAFEFWNPELEEVWEEFIKMRQRKRAPLTAHASDLILKKLGAESGSDPVLACAILNQSIASSWTDIYPLKDTHNGQSGGIQSFNATNRGSGANAHSGGKKDFNQP